MLIASGTTRPRRGVWFLWRQILELQVSEPSEPFSDEKHFAAVGRVASNWAYFEMVIDDWCMRIAGIEPNVGSCLCAQIMGSGRKMDAFIAISNFLKANATTIRELNKFTTDMNGLSEQRNRVVHDPWLVLPTAATRFELTAKRNLKLGPVQVPTEQVEELARKIERLRERFEKLAIDVQIQVKRVG